MAKQINPLIATTPFVFLGGTCAGEDYRRQMIPMLEIDYFNPVVDDWNQDSIEIENQAKQRCAYELYVFTPEQTGMYGFMEAVVSAFHRRPQEVVIVFLVGNVPDHYLRSVEASKKLLREKTEAYIADSLQEAAAFLNRTQVGSTF